MAPHRPMIPRLSADAVAHQIPAVATDETLENRVTRHSEQSEESLFEVRAGDREIPRRPERLGMARCCFAWPY
jgi:hypothetical protein